MIRVYTASKLTTAPLWRQLEKEWPHVVFHARWLKHNLIGTPDLPEFASRFWKENEIDVMNADAVLVYAKEGEHLRGALVEAGMAIAFDVPVIVVGNHPDYGTWHHHTGVHHVSTLDDACDYLKYLDDKQGTGQS